MLFGREIGAFIRPVIGLPAVVAMRVPCSIDSLAACSARLVPRSCCDGARVSRACVCSFGCRRPAPCTSSAAATSASFSALLDECEAGIVAVSSIWSVEPGHLIVTQDSHCLLQCVGVLVGPQQIVVGQLVLELSVSCPVHSTDEQGSLHRLQRVFLRLRYLCRRWSHHVRHSGGVIQHPIDHPLVYSWGPSERLHRLPQCTKVTTVLLHGLLVVLGIKKQRLQRLYEVENLLLVVVEPHANSLDLVDQFVKRLVLLGVLPVVGPLELVLYLLGALVVDRRVPLLEGLG